MVTGKLSCSTGSRLLTIAVAPRLWLSWVWLTGSSGVQSHAIFIIFAFLSQILYQSPFARFLFNHKIWRIPVSFLLKAIDLPI